jgi:linoleoyl-CoA desaturase
MTLVKFPHKVGFYQTLKKRVDIHLAKTGLHHQGNSELFIKSAIILTGYISCYIALVFFTSNIWSALLIGFLLSQFYVMIGFNIQHDANHNSYSKYPLINKIFGFSLDLLGASSELWRQAHNFLHHTYTNIDNIDSDMETFSLLRLNPHQERKPWHRFQHLYFIFIYSLLSFHWIYLSDFQKLITGKIGNYKLSKISFNKVFLLITFKIIYIFYSLILPCFVYPISYVLIANFLILALAGFNLSIVFNLAHITENNEFPLYNDKYCIQDEWAIHQIKTTANFAINNSFLTWYLGGLNYQIEHHIFPRISHIHYPKISKIVEQTCQEFNLEYFHYPTIQSAIAGHIQHLKNLNKNLDS